MEKLRALNRYQKGVLLFTVLLFVTFSILYPVVTSKTGFEYEGKILVLSEENGVSVYSGKVHGEPVSFTVYADKSVEFRHGDTFYGPYTAKEDPTAVPEETELSGNIAGHLRGIELRRGEEIVFRGGVLDLGGSFWLYNEDGSSDSLNISVVAGTWEYSSPEETTAAEPSVSTVLTLMDGPELSNKGDGMVWFYGSLFCVVTALSILFADELFRWNLRFQIRNAERAEPSDWEIAGRYIGWTVLPIMALVVYIVGLG